MAVILDCEIYKNYFLLSFKDLKTGKIIHYEYNDNINFNGKEVSAIMSRHQTISFNGFNFDLPLIQAAIEGYTVEGIKNLANMIIRVQGASWRIVQNEGIKIPQSWDHIDLIEVAPGRASLKIYGARMHALKLQDLPIEPDEVIKLEQMETIKKYCENDLVTTELLYNTLLPQIELRKSMSKQYGIDLKSKSDAQIAEHIIKSEMKKITGKNYQKPKISDNITFKYMDPRIVSFESEELQEIFKKLLNYDFEVSGNGSIKNPDWLKNTKVKIGKAEYQMGVGGLHSCEKSQFVKAKKDELLLDIDVASYYPEIILQQQLSPRQMGHDFLKLYQSIVTRRLKAKAENDKVTADTLKICVNGSFGKLGSKYSPLYAPELLIQVTVTGQLCLLMLIERMEKNGIQIMSANTDGIVCLLTKNQERKLEEIMWGWMLDTSFHLERTDYRLLASRDVNNYIAIKTDGKIKGKGVFGSKGLSKNPDRNIIYTAIAELLKSGKPIKETITKCQDVTQFVIARHVQGGAVFKGIKIGKAVRYYNSIAPDDDCIRYAKNGNKVPKSDGCNPIMDLPADGKLPSDIDYNKYIKDATKLLKEIGYA